MHIDLLPSRRAVNPIATLIVVPAALQNRFLAARYQHRSIAQHHTQKGKDSTTSASLPFSSSSFLASRNLLGFEGRRAFQTTTKGESPKKGQGSGVAEQSSSLDGETSQASAEHQPTSASPSSEHQSPQHRTGQDACTSPTTPTSTTPKTPPSPRPAPTKDYDPICLFLSLWPVPPPPTRSEVAARKLARAEFWREQLTARDVDLFHNGPNYGPLVFLTPAEERAAYLVDLGNKLDQSFFAERQFRPEVKEREERESAKESERRGLFGWRHYLGIAKPKEPENIAESSSGSGADRETGITVGSASGKANMSDAEYAKFLEGASSRGENASAASTGGGGNKKKNEFTAASVDGAVPKGLDNVDATYTSDADEPFQPVSLKCEGGSKDKVVSLDLFKTTTSHSTATSISKSDFDPRCEYAELIEKVAKAGSGEASFFRVEHGGARCEYWIVSPADGGERMVGLRAGSVES